MTDQSLMQKYIKIVGVVALYWSVSVSLVYGLYAYKHWRNVRCHICGRTDEQTESGNRAVFCLGRINPQHGVMRCNRTGYNRVEQAFMGV